MGVLQHVLFSCKKNKAVQLQLYGKKLLFIICGY